MAKLTTCKDCGATLSKRAKTCPACGAPQKTAMTASQWSAGFVMIAFVAIYAFWPNEKPAPAERTSERPVAAPVATAPAPVASKPPAPVQDNAETAAALRTLRDEGIQHIGWIAGNTEGHPIWPEMKPYVAQGGEYYDFLLRLAPRGSNHEAEAYANVALYRAWVEKGREARPFNEAEGMRRLERVQQIFAQLNDLFKKMKTN